METNITTKTAIISTNIGDTLININQTIWEIICSEDFKKRLDVISQNYTNLKQESHIRNTILELFNEKYLAIGRAFAEHPRKDGLRADLSIVSSENHKIISTIEFKYNFSGDYKKFKSYKDVIDADFTREVDKHLTSMFILIVAHWNKINSKKTDFDGTWGISSNLSRFISKENGWLKNIRVLFRKYKKEDVFAYELDPIFTEVLDTTYHIFILSREKIEEALIRGYQL